MAIEGINANIGSVKPKSEWFWVKLSPPSPYDLEGQP